MVEDDAEIREMLRDYLAAENYGVVCAPDGRADCERFDAEDFSLDRARITVPILIVYAKARTPTRPWGWA